MLRVIQWTTGSVGTHAAIAVHEHPELELVGCYAWSEEKSGKDIGELLGIGNIGVKATNNKDEILATEADCVLYMQQGELNPYGALDDICALLESGKNVVSTAVTSLIYPTSMDQQVVDMLEESCQKGGTSFHATGIEPGWGAEVLPLTMSPIFKKVEHILVQELMDYSTYDQPETMFDMMGFGKDPDEDVIMCDPDLMIPTFQASIMMVADGCAAKVEDYIYRREVAVTDETFDIKVGRIEKGTVAAMRFSVTGVINGREAITVEHISRLRPDIAPEWPNGRGWRVTIKGEPSMVLETHIGTDGEDEVDQGCMATAMHAVHAVYPVCKAGPGIKTFLDLPMITGRKIFDQ